MDLLSIIFDHSCIYLCTIPQVKCENDEILGSNIKVCERYRVNLTQVRFLMPIVPYGPTHREFWFK